MKFHKTILTLLAAMLAVIGTTGTVIHAQGNDSEPTPGDYLNATQLSDFNSLRQDVKDGLKEGILADLASKSDLSEGFKKQVFAEVVEAEKNAPPFSDHFHTRDQTNRHFHCSNRPNLAISVGERIIVYTSASCQQRVDGFTSDAEFWSRPTGHHIVSRTYHNASFASAWVYGTYHPNTEYKYCGAFRATVNQEPTPTPTYRKLCLRRYT